MRTLLLLVIFLASFLVGSGLIGWLTQDIPGLPPLIRVFLNIITPVFLLVSIFGLEGIARAAGILQFAMPAAVLVAIVAMEHNLQPRLRHHHRADLHDAEPAHPDCAAHPGLGASPQAEVGIESQS